MDIDKMMDVEGYTLHDDVDVVEDNNESEAGCNLDNDDVDVVDDNNESETEGNSNDDANMVEDNNENDIGQKESCKPCIGMEFQSQEEAYDFYNLYAKNIGFGIHKSKIYRNAKGVITSRRYLCEREGVKGKDKRRSGIVMNPRRDKRDMCTAMMAIKLTAANVWYGHVYGDGQKESCKPCIGMEFQSQEEAYDFYNLYAKNIGFGIHKSKIYRNAKGVITSRRYLCEREGVKGKDKRRSGIVMNPRRDKRDMCTAMMAIKLTAANVWKVDYFVEKHSHAFVSPSKVAKIRSHKKMSDTSKSLIGSFSQSMGPSQIASTLTTLDGGEHVVVSQQDTRSYIKKIRKNNMGCECVDVIRGFMDKRIKDDGFFYEVEIDEDYRMRSVFWVDGRSRMAYHQFGDVVVFDTTYRTNRFSMPFAPFTGVNHHRQSILFGCALMADETEESFVWLFKSWLKAMSGKIPVSIITDQCGAMAKAIQKVFTGTIHRLCLWHIGQNEVKHLGQTKLQHKGFERDYNKCKYSQTVDEFETRWNDLISTYELHDNNWLKAMYDVREQWITCYTKHVFFAGMTTTQRSESMNAFFDGYVSARTPLNEFVRQYDLALVHWRNQENHEDYITINTNPHLWSRHPLEVQAGKVYTKKIFELFQEQLRDKETFFAKKKLEEGHISIFDVGSYESDCPKYVVSIDESDGRVSCSCKKFEFEGILCAHVLKVYQKTDVVQIPSSYILPRWIIEARYGHVRVYEGDCGNLDGVSPMMVWNVRAAGLKCIDMGIQSVEHYNTVMPLLRDIVSKLDIIKSCSQDKDDEHENNANRAEGSVPLDDQIHIRILDPERCITKGRPKNATRIRSSLEEAQDKAKKRMCGNCKKMGHYATTCPKKKD